MLNPQSPVPLYRQLADLLESRIGSGHYSTGNRIPSEHELAATFGIGRPTARQATERLVRKGLLERRRGAGTFVRPAAEPVDLFSLAGTTAAFQQRGITVETGLLATVARRSVDRPPDNPFAGGQAYVVSRVTRVGGHPVLVEDTFLHPEIFSGLERLDLENQSLAETVRTRYFLEPTGGRQMFRIARPTGAMAAALKIPPAEPVLEVKRFLDFPAAAEAIFAVLLCRTDRFVFSQTIGSP